MVSFSDTHSIQFFKGLTEQSEVKSVSSDQANGNCGGPGVELEEEEAPDVEFDEEAPDVECLREETQQGSSEDGK